MSEPSPLHLFLGVQTQADRELASILKDAARHAEKLIDELGGKAGIGSQVRRAQLQLMRRELLRQSEELWGGVTKAMQRNMTRAAVAAAQAESFRDSFLFKAAGVNLPEYQAAQMLQAIDNVPTLMARSLNGIPLSEQVYRTKALADGQVDRTINRAILLGKSARELAEDVRGLIRPDVPGGVSYAANRLARTELNNAFHRTQIDLRKDDPWSAGMKWNLSGSHPRPDVCNDYADGVHYKNGEPGVFRNNEVPGKPHPNCLCYMTTVTVEPDEFIDQFFAGEYDTYIDEKIYSHLPNPVC